MKRILKALDYKLKAQDREIKSLNHQIQYLRQEIESQKNLTTLQELRGNNINTSLNRIHEKVCKAWKQWDELALPTRSEDNVNWLDHLQYIAEHKPEDQ